ncbi:MAG: indolepyruvate oxidoreductase subunit beta [Paludibacter sp.]|nr:indolepyruvate oxidoreductase subunit beta [Paludibacter sp.]
MIKNIILAGVGGQGILTIAAIIDHAAMQKNLYIKQAEVHGMSQRGGAVESHLRISDQPIFSDLIPLGEADLILSLEPMESLRYLPFLSEKGVIITATKPFVNISNYPDEQKVLETIKNTGHNYTFVDAEETAKEAGSVKTVNIVMAGAAAKHIGIDKEQLQQSIRAMFAAKGEAIVEMNLKAFEMGANLANS